MTLSSADSAGGPSVRWNAGTAMPPGMPHDRRSAHPNRRRPGVRLLEYPYKSLPENISRPRRLALLRKEKPMDITPVGAALLTLAGVVVLVLLVLLLGSGGNLGRIGLAFRTMARALG